jgi:hypothetical protein
MAVTAFRVSVIDSPTLLVRGDRDGNNVVIKNADAAAAFSLGGVLVTYAGGFAMLAGDVDQITLAPGEELYAVASTGITVVAHVIQKARA